MLSALIRDDRNDSHHPIRMDIRLVCMHTALKVTEVLRSFLLNKQHNRSVDAHEMHVSSS